MSQGRGMGAEVRLEVRLNGAATRLAHEDLPLRAAVEQLEEMAAGRADLLAGAAGSILGGYLARPASTHPQLVYAVALLVLAGADVDLIVEHVDRARSRSTESLSRLPPPAYGFWIGVGVFVTRFGRRTP